MATEVRAPECKGTEKKQYKEMRDEQSKMEFANLHFPSNSFFCNHNMGDANFPPLYRIEMVA